MKRILLYRLGLALSLGTSAGTVSAQIDIVGDWNQPTGAILAFFEEAIDRGGGPDIGDYAGLPINEALRYKAAAWSPSWLTMPEHQCVPHPSTYQYRSPGGLSVLKEYDPVTQRLSAYRLYGTYGLARTVWMDGSPRPPAHALHTFEGFSTGTWEGNKLVVETTHLKAGFIRRNGVAHSDRARMIEHFIRHGDYLTIVTAVDDPVYFDEPFVRSTDFKVNERATTQLAEFGGFVNGGDIQAYGGSQTFFKCAPAEEVALEPGAVPSFMPGENPELDMFSKSHSVPLEAALGGAATMYPEYALRLGAAAANARQVSSARSPRPQTTRPAVVEEPPAVGSLHVAGQVFMVTAGGRNVAVQIGPEGVLVVNPGSAELADGVLAEIRKLAGDKRIRVIVNTNDLPEHTGGNTKVGAGPTPAAQRAAVIAHESATLRIATRGAPSSELPSDSFYRGTRELYFNEEPIEIIHVPSATSDGDVLVFFRKSDVIVAGDVIQDLTYPVIRLDAGGTLDGTIAALNRMLGMTIAAWRAQGGTLVIPNRGRIYDEGDVTEYRDMLTIVRDRVQHAIDNGRTLQEVKAAALARDYDGRYAAGAGPASADSFIEMAYASQSAAQQ